MLPAQPKYGSGARRAAPRCAQTLLQRVLLPMGPACSLKPQRKAHPGSAWVGNRAQGMVGHEAQVALAAKQLKKNEGGN